MRRPGNPQTNRSFTGGYHPQGAGLVNRYESAPARMSVFTTFGCVEPVRPMPGRTGPAAFHIVDRVVTAALHTDSCLYSIEKGTRSHPRTPTRQEKAHEESGSAVSSCSR